MNEFQKTQINNMRCEGLGYKAIAKELDISENTVKSFCRRNNLTKAENISTITYTEDKNYCKNCGELVEQNDKKKKKQFCSDKCRMEWWNTHRELVHHKNIHTKLCPGCNKEFKYYGKAERKYCSYACYIADRFGGRNNV